MNTQLYTNAANGFCLVLAAQTINGIGSDPWFQLDASNFENLNISYTNAVTTLAAPPNLINIGGGTAIQIAWLYDPVNFTFSGSVNGSAIVTVPTNGNISDPTLPVQFFRTNAGAPVKTWVNYFATYDATVPLTLLPTLSTLGVVPPKIINISPAVISTPIAATAQIPGIPVKYNNGLWR